MKLGSAYELADEADGPPQPFVLIGSQVYGNQENPFVNSSGCHLGANPPDGVCDYYFLAPTSALRNAQSFLVQDIAWDSFRKNGTIEFAPALDKLSIASTYPPGDFSGKSVKAKATDTTFFSVSGFDLGKLDTTQGCDDPDHLKQYCLKLFIGTEAVDPPQVKVASQNLATFLFSVGAIGKSKSVRFQVTEKPFVANKLGPDLPVEWDLAVPKTTDDASKASISPSYLYKGDSQPVTVTGGGIDFSTVKDVLFENTPIFTVTSKKPEASEIKFLVPTSVTNSSGRKEFTIELVAVGKDGKSTTTTATVTVDVVRR
jgi:hypothetical protein